MPQTIQRQMDRTANVYGAVLVRWKRIDDLCAAGLHHREDGAMVYDPHARAQGIVSMAAGGLRTGGRTL
jgi:hypothetical protein